MTSNELLNAFKERAKSSATHRDDPVIIRRSSLLNDEVGTLPFAENPAKSGAIEIDIASSEQDRHDMETDVTQENLSFAEENTFEEGTKRCLLRQKNFRN